jgi:hypothetical protein
MSCLSHDEVGQAKAPTIESHRPQGSQAPRLTGPKAHRPQGSQAPRLTSPEHHRPRGSHALSSTALSSSASSAPACASQPQARRSWLKKLDHVSNTRAERAAGSVFYPMHFISKMTDHQGCAPFARAAYLLPSREQQRPTGFGGTADLALKVQEHARYARLMPRDTDWVCSPARNGTNGRNRCGLTSIY